LLQGVGCTRRVQGGTVDHRARKEAGMTTEKQRTAARQNIKKAQEAARRKRTIAHLPKETRTALGKQGAKVAAGKRA
jgi:hypothetical protein